MEQDNLTSYSLIPFQVYLDRIPANQASQIVFVQSPTRRNNETVSCPDYCSVIFQPLENEN
jgi:hypothetical protein